MLAAAIMLLGGSVALAESPSYSLTLRDHAFEPDELTVPAGKKIKLEVRNAGKMVAEFESYDLNREKIIAGGGSVVIFIGPLKPGSYRFFDDFDQKAAGRVIAE